MKCCEFTKKTFLTAILLLLIVLTLCVIWGSSLEGPKESSKKSQAVLENVVKPILGPIVGRDNITEYFVRKLGHFTEFFALGLESLLLLAVRKELSLHWILHIVAAGFTVGAVDETLQIFTNRGSSIADVWLDFSGFLVGAAMVLVGCWILKRCSAVNKAE